MFGVDFTLPAEADSEGDSEGRPAYLVAGAPTIDLGQGPAQFIAMAQPLSLGEPLQVVPTFRCKAVVAAPLCDTARHERSGVQLI